MQKFDLSPSSITRACDEIRGFYEKNDVDKKEILRMTLMAEEVMLKYQGKFGEQTTVYLLTSKVFGKTKVRLIFNSEKMNPFKKDEEDDSIIINSLVHDLDKKANSWKYIDKKNVITLTTYPKTKFMNVARIFLGLALGLVVGFVLRWYFGQEWYGGFVNSVVQPIGDTYTGVLCVMAIFMIFFSFPLGISKFGNMMSFQKSVQRMMRIFFFVPVGIIVLSFLALYPFLNISSVAVDSAEIAKTQMGLVLGFIPNNIITPFLNFDCIQVIIIGVMFGYAFVKMGENGNCLIKAFDSCNLVAVITNQALEKLVPIYVGLMGLKLLGAAGTHFLPILLKVGAVVIVWSVILMMILVAIISVKYEVNPFKFIHKLMPSFLINLSSASVGASFVTLFNDVSFGCGVDVAYNQMIVNMGLSIFKPIYTVFLTALPILMAWTVGMPISVGWIITVALLSFVLSISIPNIPDGAASVIILLFSQLGFGETYASIGVSVNAFLQFIIVPVNVFILQCVIILLAGMDERIDKSAIKN